MKLTLTLPLPISINELYINQYIRGKGGMWIPTGKRILSKKGEKVKYEIQKAALEQMKHQKWNYEYTKNNYIYLDSYIYFNRKGRDDNNIYKLLADALEGIVYDNDSRILVRTQKILFDINNPRMEITFKPVDYVGIFDSVNHFVEFRKKCESCVRLKRNCSILKKAIEGFVQEEIKDFVCSKYKPIKG